MMRPRTLIAVAAVVGVTLAGCSRGGDDAVGEPAPASPVALGYSGPSGLKIGVITSSTGPGSGVRPLAEGARLAEYRLDGLAADGGAVELVVADDQGDDDEARAAVEDLVDEGVSGIVYASAGPHVEAGLDEAAEAGVPVLLPYLDDAELLTSDGDAWATGVTGQEAARVVQRRIDDHDHEKVVVLEADEEPRAGSRRIDGEVANVGAAQDGTYDAAIAEIDLDEADAVVLWMGAARAADVVASLQRASVRAEVLVAPTALEPAFGRRLVEIREATGAIATDASLLTVGRATSDDPAVAGAFTQALRIALHDDGLRAVDTSVDTFAEAEDVVSVDAGAHDAVVSFAAAAAQADSLEPGAVADALARLDAEPRGRVGPSWDPDRPEGLTGNAVTLLRSDTYTGGPRADLLDAGESLITWFAVGSSSG